MAETSQVIPRVWPEAQAVVKPLSQAEREALTESIQLEGVHTPIVVLPDGRIIDGHHRWELSGGHALFEVRDVSEERALELAATSTKSAASIRSRNWPSSVRRKNSAHLRYGN